MVHQDLQNFIDRPKIEAVEGKSADNESYCWDCLIARISALWRSHLTPRALKVLAAEQATQVSVKPRVQLINIQPVPPAQGFEDLGGDDPGARPHFQDRNGTIGAVLEGLDHRLGKKQ